MKNATVTDGQLGQLAVKQNELFRRAKEGNFSSLDDVIAALQQVIEGQAPTPPVRKEKPKPAILALANESVEYSALETAHEPLEFYQNRDGLYVWDEFRNRVGKYAKQVQSLPLAIGKSYDLQKNSYDRQITDELPQGYEWDPSELCARLAQMIEKQWGGTAGELLNNGYANLFCVPGFVVDVSWYAGGGGWGVYAYRLGGGRWRAGYRVFVRN